MPAIRHASKRKAPPAGFSDIEDDLLVFSNKMKDAENASTDNVSRHQVLWPIFQISHQRSRYIYELYYEKEAISKELYEWLLKNGYADPMLIAKWKKTGYEKVCVSLALRMCVANANRDIAVLFEMRADKGDQLQLNMHMSSPQGADEGGPGR
jgi:bud site selection protein 31